jgi:hypothetical protein
MSRWPPVEAFVTDLKLDDQIKAHAQAAGPIFEAWYGRGSEADKFAAVTENIEKCYLFEGLPAGLGKQMEDWMKRAGELGISAEARRGFGAVARWRSGWTEGLERYKTLWEASELPAAAK